MMKVAIPKRATGAYLLGAMRATDNQLNEVRNALDYIAENMGTDNLPYKVLAHTRNNLEIQWEAMLDSQFELKEVPPYEA